MQIMLTGKNRLDDFIKGVYIIRQDDNCVLMFI